MSADLLRRAAQKARDTATAIQVGRSILQPDVAVAVAELLERASRRAQDLEDVRAEVGDPHWSLYHYPAELQDAAAVARALMREDDER